MNTYLINNDNTIQHTVKSAVIEKSNLVDSLQIVCPRMYNGYDMSEFDLLMEYQLPSGTEKVVKLVLSDANYKDGYLLYVMPDGVLTTAITSEAGDVKFTFTFTKAVLNYDGETLEYSRNLGSFATLKILPLSSFFHTSEEELSDLASLYLENKKAILALNEVVSQLNAKSESTDVDASNSETGKSNVISI